MQNHGGAQDRMTILNWKAKDQHERPKKGVEGSIPSHKYGLDGMSPLKV